MAVCYILYSKSVHKFYTGVTTNKVEERLTQHNQGAYGSTHFTSISNDWEIYLILEAMNFAHAIRIERKIKAMKSSNYIRNLLKYHELKAKLLTSTMST